MRAYIIKRLLLVIPTVLLVSMILFSILRLIPGDIIDLMRLESEDIWSGRETVNIRHALGLDMPMLTQYGRWIGVVPQADGNFSGIFQGDLGDSLWNGLPVTQHIADKLPVTLELGFLGIITVILLSLPIGIYSAIRQDTWGDYVGRSLATLSIALPAFWVGIMVVLACSLWFGMGPPIRYIPFIEDPIRNLKQVIIPSLVLGSNGMGTITRLVRSQMLEVLRQDYIRTAWAKGLKERVIVTRHALRNVLIPVVTAMGDWIPILIGGTVFIEVIFNIPGMGRLLVESIKVRDYTLISGVIFLYSIILILANLAIDLTYGYLDPRVHYK